MNETTGGRWLIRVFYGAVVTVSLVGAVQGARGWLKWVLPAAVLAVAVLELGGIVLAHHAAKRRELGESATSARVLSALIAAVAVAIQIAGHQKVPAQATFFAVMSALGYVTFLIDAEASRRDALRARGLLAEVPPTYGLTQWIREPGITRRARVMAQERAAVRLDAQRRGDNGEDVESPTRLDALASLAAARQETRVTERQNAIAKVLRRKIRKAVDKDTADIAVAVYDLDEIAAQLTARADYDALTDLVGADLAPARLTGTTRTANANDPTANANDPTANANDPTANANDPTANANDPTANANDPAEEVVAEVTQHLSATRGTPTGTGEQPKIESERGTSAALPVTAPPVAPAPPGDDQSSAPQWGPYGAGAGHGARGAQENANGHGSDVADSEELRTAARQAWKAATAAGTPMTGAALGRAHGMSPRWGQKRATEARAELAAAELPGQMALTDTPAVNGREVELARIGR